MIEELSIVARARMQQINGHSGESLPRPKRRTGFRAVIAKAACRVGCVMVSFGRRLECYEMNLLAETDGLRSAKAQVN